MSLSGFHDVRFPLALAFGAVGGPERRTEIVQLANGAEQRNSVWSGSRRRWDIGSAVSTLDELNALIEFFEARSGPLHGFRFRDFTDDRSSRPDQAETPFDQLLSEGDGVRTQFQLVKHYGDTQRRILKPVEGSVGLALDGAAITEGFSVDHTTGQVSFDVAPDAGAVVTAGYRFDCPARFDGDAIDASLEGFGAGRIVNVRLIELIG